MACIDENFLPRIFLTMNFSQTTVYCAYHISINYSLYSDTLIAAAVLENSKLELQLVEDIILNFALHSYQLVDV